MAEETEPTSGKKHRVIHWNPDAGREQARRRWDAKRIAGWTLGGLLALVVVGRLVIGPTIKAIWGPDIFEPRSTVAAAEPNAKDSNAAFVTQAKAENLHELAGKELASISRMPTDHPTQLQQMVLLKTTFVNGEAYLQDKEFGRAFATFETLRAEIDAFAKNIKAKGEAQQGYDKILLRVKELELARSLAPGVLDSAFDAAGGGRKLMENGDFTGAMREFQRGYAELAKAEQALGEYVRENLLKGQRALALGQKAEAKQAFQAALEKSNGNDAAIKGLARAENIDRVYALLLQGEKLEKEADYAAAAEAYQKAFSLDGASAEAQQGQSRAARLEKETKFANAKNAADEAFKRRDWPKAIEELQNALKVYPQKTDITAQLKLARENSHKDGVQKSLAKAFAFENEHKWPEARDAYNATMALEPGHADATEGYKRAGTVIRALLQYDTLIEAAEQHANKAEFQIALKRFNEALSFKPSYLEYSDRVLQLRTLLQQQSKPVDVTFKSDGKTHVRISTFKSPEQLETKVFKMLPGDYEVIGSRRNYKDVRMILQVRAGMPPPVVSVVCNQVQ